MGNSIFIDKCSPSCEGQLKIKVYDLENKLLEDWSANNLVVTKAREIMCGAIADRTTSISHIGVGTGSAIPTVDDTHLTDLQTVSITNYSLDVQYEVSFEASIGYTSMNGYMMTEYGLMDDDNNLFSRKTRSAIEKTPYIRIDLEWIIRFL